jgi:hypothetical protein
MATGNHSSVPEGFKEVPGYSGCYFINQQGDVWSTCSNKILRTYTDVAYAYPLKRLNGISLGSTKTMISLTNGCNLQVKMDPRVKRKA